MQAATKMTLNNIFHNFVWCLLFLKSVESANILCLIALPSPSHHIWNRGIVNALASRGHNVTVLSPDFDKIAPKNVHYLKINEIYNSEAVIDFYKFTFSMSETSSNQFMTAVDAFSFLAEQCRGSQSNLIIKFK